MTIENISEGLESHQISKRYLDTKRKIESQKEDDTTSSAPRSDKVEISEDARRLMKQDSLVRSLEEDLKNVPESEVRQEKIERAEAREQLGHYERKEVLEKVVEAVLKEVGGMGNSESPAIEDTEVHWDKIKEVEKRVEERFYESREVLNTIIDILLRS